MEQECTNVIVETMQETKSMIQPLPEIRKRKEIKRMENLMSGNKITFKHKPRSFQIKNKK